MSSTSRSALHWPVNFLQAEWADVFTELQINRICFFWLHCWREQIQLRMFLDWIWSPRRSKFLLPHQNWPSATRTKRLKTLKLLALKVFLQTLNLKVPMDILDTKCFVSAVSITGAVTIKYYLCSAQKRKWIQKYCTITRLCEEVNKKKDLKWNSWIRLTQKKINHGFNFYVPVSSFVTVVEVLIMETTFRCCAQ